MRVAALVAVLMAAGALGQAQAQSLAAHGYLDLRVAAPSDNQDWSDGGLGKTRFGDANGDGLLLAPTGALALAWQATPALLASAQVQYQPEQRHELDVLEAWVRYRPVSTTPWRWSLKAGVFFPPISLENDNIGWTSRWTLSPSAINNWVGEEFRATGLEFRLERRAMAGEWHAVAGLFGRNDPAGELLAARGWALGDLTSGANAILRQPDVYAATARAPVPVLFRPFVEIDDRVGWYAGIGRDGAGGGGFSLLRYDNRGNPRAWEAYAGRRVFVWHTRFWSLGGKARIGDIELLAQAMDGGTAFEPRPGMYLDTRFSSAYLLAARDRGRWQPALRLDWFRTEQLSPPTGDPLDDPLDEHGHALTAALNWRPREQVRISGEVLRVDSSRDQRRLAGQDPRQVEVVVQLSLRYLF